MKKILFLGILLFAFLNMSAQSLAEFKWKNRLILVFTESTENQNFQNQLQLFEKDLKAFQERKLVLIHAIQEKQKIIIPEMSGWQDSNLYQKMKRSKDGFEVVLIGLDGGVKLRQKDILETEKLFDLIDSMPMRKAELQNQND